MSRSQQYRDYVRYGCRALAGPEHDDVRMGEPISYMRLGDLEALFELIFGIDPRTLAPGAYRPRR